MKVFKTLNVGCKALACCAALLFAGSTLVTYAAPASPETSLEAQADRTVSGVVVDEMGDPIVGAFVTVAGKPSLGVMTDIDGKFSLKAPSGSTITVSCIGFLNAEAAAGSDLTIKLMTDLQNLEEAVVVGYGTQKKANLTGAISNINEKAISATTSTDLTSKLQGKVSGLNIRNTSGEPGSYNNTINIRGFGTPLFIIDGIQRSSTDFNRLNSEDIESVSVLKDASAAIYGLNAANGVILVTTKTGKGGKTRFQFNANVGISSPANRVEMCDAYGYYLLRNDAAINAGGDAYISSEELAKWESGEYTSTDWYDETFKSNTVRQEYSVSAEGGSEKVQYYFNLNSTQDEGLLKSGDLNYDKLSFRSNVKAQLTETLQAKINVSAWKDNRTTPTSGFFNIWRGATTAIPWKTVYANNQEGYYNDVRDGQSYNPVAISYSDNVGYNRWDNTAIQTDFDLSWKPKFAPGLEIKGNVAYDARFYHNKALTLKCPLYTYAEETDSYTEQYWSSKSSIGEYRSNETWLTTQLQANYKKTFAEKHNLALTYVFETRSYDESHNNTNKYYDFYTNDQVDYAGDTDMTSTGNESHTRNMSHIGRINYDYAGKYLLEVAARYDGSYRYHPNVRWGFFPVVSLGYRISEENFIKDNVNWLSNLKIRGSYGAIGQDAGNAFQYISAFKSSGGGWAEFEDGVITEGVSNPALVNENLTWTTAYLANIGLDLGLFDSKLNFTFDAFQRDTKGILAYRNVSVPNTYGASFPQENLNSNRVHGLEFSASYQDRIGDFFYSISGNCTVSRTMNLYIERSSFLSQYSQWRNGSDYRNTNIAWIYNYIGQFTSQEQIDNYAVYGGTNGNKYVLPGDWMYEDTNDDGVIDGDDCMPISYGYSTDGSNQPVWNYGLTLSGSWRGFDINILFQGAAGFTTYHGLTYTIPFWENGNVPTWFLDCWHHEDRYDASSPWVAGEWPAIRLGSYAPYQNSYASTMSYLDCSYVRLKNVEIGYTFTQPFIKKIGLDQVRLFVSGNNLLTFCNKYVKPYDPEVMAGSANTGWVYPLMKTFNMGINVNF